MKSTKRNSQDLLPGKPWNEEDSSIPGQVTQPVEAEIVAKADRSSSGEKEKDEGEGESLERILARRAALIAKPLEEEEKGEKIELVLFQIGKELYGLDVQSILDIHPCKKITRLPRVPQWITGLTNLGGHILAVVDLQSFFGLSPAEISTVKAPESSYLIRIASQEIELALQVDDVMAIEVLLTSKIQEKTDVTRSLPTEYIRGVYQRNSIEHPLVLILDLANLLADPRLVVQEEGF